MSSAVLAAAAVCKTCDALVAECGESARRTWGERRAEIFDSGVREGYG